VFDPDKIEEWIQEVKERPTSAELIIQFVANRLRDLTEWNESLRAENLELRSGARVEEYERQITHLEYQLELLKRQVSGEVDLDILADVALKPVVESLNLIVYGPLGRLLRLEFDTNNLHEGHTIYHLRGIEAIEPEPPRTLIASSAEELMLIFTSGRIVTLPVAALPLSQASDIEFDWEAVPIPEEPKIGETLACVAPISTLALADFYLQTSRRGYIKKIRKALAPTIMENKYIGTGVKVEADQTLSLMMGYEGERIVLVSFEGYIQCITEDMLPYAIVEAMRLGKSDHLIAVFPAREEKAIIMMTQVGKVIHREMGSLETATDLQRKGRMLYSTARRQAGVRVVGAGAVDQDSWCLSLHEDGQLITHTTAKLVGTGSIPASSEIIDFITFQVLEPPERRNDQV
jgi:DNA gyrase/topoisomerase IV subunit A